MEMQRNAVQEFLLRNLKPILASLLPWHPQFHCLDSWAPSFAPGEQRVNWRANCGLLWATSSPRPLWQFQGWKRVTRHGAIFVLCGSQIPQFLMFLIPSQEVPRSLYEQGLSMHLWKTLNFPPLLHVHPVNMTVVFLYPSAVPVLLGYLPNSDPFEWPIVTANSMCSKQNPRSASKIWPPFEALHFYVRQGVAALPMNLIIIILYPLFSHNLFLNLS